MVLPVLLCSAVRAIFRSYTVHRTPYIVHRTPYIVHRTSYTAHRASCIVHRASCIVHRASYSAHRAPSGQVDKQNKPSVSAVMVTKHTHTRLWAWRTVKGRALLAVSSRAFYLPVITERPRRDVSAGFIRTLLGNRKTNLHFFSLRVSCIPCYET